MITADEWNWMSDAVGSEFLASIVEDHPDETEQDLFDMMFAHLSENDLFNFMETFHPEE